MGEEGDIVWSIVKTSLVITRLDPLCWMSAMNSHWHHSLPEMRAWAML